MHGYTRLRAKLWPIRATAAGGINTSIASFANWLRLHLDRGEFEGQRLLSPTLIQQLHTPRVHVSAPEFAEYGDVHYGLGFRSHWYRGERVVSHAGGWIGWSTLMTMLPDHGFGVAVFTNRNPNPVSEMLANYVFDRVCGKEPIPWFDRYRELRRKALAQIEVDRQARKATRRPNTRPSHDVADYAGDYDNPGYGRITITHAEGELNWRTAACPSRSRTGMMIRSSCPRRPAGCCPTGSPSHFLPTEKVEIAGLAAPFEPLVKDIVFTRTAAGACTNPAFRQHCTGTFSHGGTTVVVGQDNDGQLTLIVASQPAYKLRPYQSRTFVIDELEGFGWSSIPARTGKWMNCSFISRMARSWLGERRVTRKEGFAYGNFPLYYNGSSGAFRLLSETPQPIFPWIWLTSMMWMPALAANSRRTSLRRRSRHTRRPAGRRSARVRHSTARGRPAPRKSLAARRRRGLLRRWSRLLLRACAEAACQC